ncbi:hypothetical protein CYLTODRAFT_457047 [Cylindrobasidium torrendii FP15055 ss-10]|uniref:Uncharacterized protein n=1 Tax=Cylindrobasidium torrendii FP15055 ss-10 TaxID=1314674 RepID=A0A0D7B4Z2_9AGAR|nr:hypothetical protein CYLTODRAFT_457047 [Cylindrobasidium torrendii FP15055 ss-10]
MAFLVLVLALLPASVSAINASYGPKILKNGDTLSKLYTRDVNSSGDGGWQKPNKDWNYDSAVWMGEAGTNVTKTAWRYGEDDSTTIAFKYNASIPSALDMDIRTPEGALPLNGYIDSTAQVTYTDSTTVAKRAEGSEVFDGSFNQIPWSARYIAVEFNYCRTPTTFTITATDASGQSNTTTGKEPRLDIPNDWTYPLDIVFSSEPDVGGATATLQDDQPLLYAIGDGEGKPEMSASSLLGFFHRPKEETCEISMCLFNAVSNPHSIAPWLQVALFVRQRPMA